MKISLHNVTKSFSNQLVLDHISFTLETSSLALIGPSGGGKSTLLKAIAGLLPIDEGQIGLDQLQLHQQKSLTYRRQIGYVFQHGGLFSHLSAMDNIVLPLVKVHGYTVQQANQKATELLKRFGLFDHAHKRPHALSGGQQQRIAIARAIASTPKVLLLDEPTSALDPEYTSEVLQMLAELSKQGIQMIIVTHEMGFAANACQHVAFLNKGKIEECQPSQQLFHQPQSQALQQFLSQILEWKV